MFLEILKITKHEQFMVTINLNYLILFISFFLSDLHQLDGFKCQVKHEWVLMITQINYKRSNLRETQEDINFEISAGPFWVLTLLSNFIIMMQHFIINWLIKDK